MLETLSATMQPHTVHLRRCKINDPYGSWSRVSQTVYNHIYGHPAKKSKATLSLWHLCPEHLLVRCYNQEG